MKTLKILSIIVFFVFAIISCQEKPIADDDYPIEDIEQEEVETVTQNFETLLNAELIGEPIYTDYSVSYSFELPYEIENIELIRIVITSIILKQFEYDISDIWEVDINGVHHSNFVYKNTNIKLSIDPNANMFCIELVEK